MLINSLISKNHRDKLHDVSCKPERGWNNRIQMWQLNPAQQGRKHKPETIESSATATITRREKNKFEWVAWRENNHHFFWLVSLQKGIENNKALGTGNHDITLKQSFICDLHSWRDNDNDNYDEKKSDIMIKWGDITLVLPSSTSI